jgi:phage/plasmid-associated DNA primase
LEDCFGNDFEKVCLFLGYTLCHTQKWGKALYIYSEPGVGKSSFFSLFTKLYPAGNRSFVKLWQKNLNDFALAQLEHSYVNIDDDVSFNKEGCLRYQRFIQGWRDTAERKGGKHFELEKPTKFILTSNTMPLFDEFSVGMNRRLLIVTRRRIENFDKKYEPRPDKDVFNEVPDGMTWNSKADILAAAMKGAKTLIEQKFSTPKWDIQDFGIIDFSFTDFIDDMKEKNLIPFPVADFYDRYVFYHNFTGRSRTTLLTPPRFRQECYKINLTNEESLRYHGKVRKCWKFIDKN